PFDDPARERGGHLVAVVAARVLERGTAPRVVPSGNPWGEPTKIIEPERSTLIDQDTLTVLTGAVRGEGTSAVVSWLPGEGTWVLTAFWSRDSKQGVTSFLDAGAALDYLDEHQIGAAAGALHEPGSTATELFEDSLELNADCLFWSPTMIERFTERHGYDPTVYLPLLIAHGQCRYWVPEEAPRPDFAPARPDGTVTDLGQRVRADYDRLITDLYTTDHLALIQDWAVGHGMRHKAQAAYGQNLEPVRSFRELVRVGGRAEVESLNSGDRVPMSTTNPTWRFSTDWQRSAVAGAHQGGAVRVSTELGAQMDKCYDFSLSGYRQMLDKEWALGVTKPFVHGFAAQAPDAAWPTQGRFGTVVSESWNHRHFPQWEAWGALARYWARGTAVLETGTPRTDVAVYRDGFLATAARGNAEADATAPDRLLDAEPLERAGYGVQVLDPVGLAEPGVLGTDATGATVLFPEGPAYRVLALESESLTADAARALARAAEAGLALVIVGTPPSRDTGWGGEDRSPQVAADVAQALAAARTRRVAGWDEVPGALADLGVRARAGWSGPALLSQVRDAEEGRYALVYNPSASEAVSLVLDVEGEGAAAAVDLDAGAVRPVAARTAQGRTLVDLALAPLGLAVLCVGEPAPSAGAEPEAPVRVAGALVGAGADAGALDPAGEDLGLVWGDLVVTTEEQGGARALTLADQGPADWREVPGLEDVSGTGRYRALVTGVDGGPATAGALAGARLSLGRVGGVATVSVGGHVLATVLRPDDVVEAGAALAAEAAAGREPAIEIEVRTTLRNATLAADVYMKGPWAVTHPSAPHGLIGPLRLLA
ncbi:MULTISPECIES: glycosyl hydrolase, partial [unclassified Actinomyces]